MKGLQVLEPQCAAPNPEVSGAPPCAPRGGRSWIVTLRLCLTPLLLLVNACEADSCEATASCSSEREGLGAEDAAADSGDTREGVTDGPAASAEGEADDDEPRGDDAPRENGEDQDAAPPETDAQVSGALADASVQGSQGEGSSSASGDDASGAGTSEDDGAGGPTEQDTEDEPSPTETTSGGTDDTSPGEVADDGAADDDAADDDAANDDAANTEVTLCTSASQCPGARPNCVAGQCSACVPGDHDDCGAGEYCIATSRGPRCSECEPEGNSGCFADVPACVLEDDTASCKRCDPVDHVGCGGATPFCADDYACVECLADEHCGGDTPFCRSATGTCVGCLTEDDCPAELPTCGADKVCVCDFEPEVFATNPNHCGGCGNVCTAINAAGACEGGQCVTGKCSPSWGNCNGLDSDGCETEMDPPPTPTNLKPASGAYSPTSSYASLTWDAVEPECEDVEVFYSVEVTSECEADDPDACSFADEDLWEDDLSIDEPYHRTVGALRGRTSVGTPRPGLNWWRVRACYPMWNCSQWSPPQYIVGQSAKDDLDGDGLADPVAITTAGDDRTLQLEFVNAKRAAPHGPLPIQQGELSDDAPGTARYVGDFDRDGFADVAVLARFLDTGTPSSALSGQGYLVFGAATWQEMVVAPIAADVMGLGAAGDVDGDGYADFALVEYEDQGASGGWDSLRIFSGNGERDWLSYEVALPSQDASVEPVVASMGDVDGDGLSDVAVLGERLYIDLSGSASSSVEHSVEHPFPGVTSGCILEPLGDVDRSGGDDLGLVCPGAGIAVYRSSANLPEVFQWIAEGDPATGLTGGADLTGDGLSDVLIHPARQVLSFAAASQSPSSSSRLDLPAFADAYLTRWTSAGGGDLVFSEAGRTPQRVQLGVTSQAVNLPAFTNVAFYAR